MSSVMFRLWDEESGQGMVEYALVIGLIALAVFSALTALGGDLKAFLNDFSTKLADITP